MPRSWSLSAKLGAIGAALLLMAFASIGLTLWVTWQLEGGAAAVNEAGRMRMQTWRLAQTLERADERQKGALFEQFDSSIGVLRTGDPARPLFVPHDHASQEAFALVQREWDVLKAAWGTSPAPGAERAAQQADAFVSRIDTFVSAIEKHLSGLTAILNAVQFVMVALTIGSAIALLYSAYLFIFNPLSRLQAGLSRVENGPPQKTEKIVLQGLPLAGQACRRLGDCVQGQSPAGHVRRGTAGVTATAVREDKVRTG
jgi:two-component system, NarL family, nitrate/nitrite sensor histidine kinase NarX